MKAHKNFVAALVLAATPLLMGQMAHAQMSPPPLVAIKIISGGDVKKIQAAPQAPAAQTTTVTTTVTTSAAPTAVVVSPRKDFDDTSALPKAPASSSVRTAIPIRKTVKSTPAPKETSVPARPTRIVRSTGGLPVIDAASLIAAKCAAKPKYKLGCMNRELDLAWTKMDSAEVKILNCGQMRKMESLAPAMTEALIMSKLGQIRTESDFNIRRELTVAGQVGPRATRTMQLREMMKRTKKTNALAELVCDKSQFTGLMASVGQ